MQPFIDLSWTQEDIDDFHQGQLESFRSPELGWFGMPYFLGVLGMFWNVDMFDEEGVEHPPAHWKDAWTYDEYMETMLKFVKQDASGKYIRWGSWASRTSLGRLCVHLRSFGGHLVDPEDNAHCLLGEPEAQEALWWLYDRTWKDHGFPVDAQIQENARGYAFPNQQLAMIEEGTWSLDNLAVMGIKFNWDVCPLPKGPINQSTYATDDGFGIWTGTENPDATWEVMNFMMSPFFIRLVARVQQLVPPRKSLLEEWYSLVRVRYPELEPINVELFGEAIEEGLPMPQEMFKKQGPAGQIIGPALERVYLTGSDTPDIFRDEICAEVDAAMKEFSTVHFHRTARVGRRSTRQEATHVSTRA